MIVNLKTTATDFFTRTETLMQYYDDIRKYPLLTQDDEQKLFNIIKFGSKEQKRKATITLVNSNQRLVVSAAKKYGTKDNILDLINEGNFGLLEAIEKFDLSKNVRFATFAVWYIRRAINLYCINYGNMVTKTNFAKTYHIRSQATSKFIQQEGRQPTLEELKDFINENYDIDIKDTLDIIDTRFISIDDESNDSDESQNYGDLMLFKNANSDINGYESVANSEFNNVLVKTLLSKLNEREQEIIKLSFGIGCEREYELQEIAHKIGMTSERVRQIKLQALNKLKSEYKSALDKI